MNEKTLRELLNEVTPLFIKKSTDSTTLANEISKLCNSNCYVREYCKYWLRNLSKIKYNSKRRWIQIAV